jgi:peptidoglycan/xylan/chitin deacetylase (PgdA/CDA1 family)
VDGSILIISPTCQGNVAGGVNNLPFRHGYRIEYWMTSATSEPVSGLSRRRFLHAAALSGAVIGAGFGPEIPVATARGPKLPPPANTSAKPALTGPDREKILARYRGRVPAQWGLEVSGVVTSFRSKLPAICFTFDGCGGPKGSVPDEDLIALLRREQIPTTLFLSGPFMKVNPAYVANLARDPLFLLGNHGTTHRPLSVNGKKAYGLSGTASVDEVYDEIAINKQTLEGFTNTVSTLFRSGYWVQSQC